jgi:hypothetical protein
LISCYLLILVNSFSFRHARVNIAYDQANRVVFSPDGK